MALVLTQHGAIRVEVKYLQFKGNTWYFRRRIPEDVQHLYPLMSVQIFLSLKTADKHEEAKKADLLARQQNALWRAHREGSVTQGPETHAAAIAMLESHGLKPGDYAKHWEGKDITPDRFIGDLEYLSDGEGEILKHNLPPYALLAADLFYGNQKQIPFLSEALALFQDLRGEQVGQKDFQARQKAIGRMLSEAGDMPVDRYSRENARSFVKGLLSDGCKTTTVKRYVNYVSPVFGLAVREFELNRPNIFDGIIIQNLGEDSIKREPFTLDQLHALQMEYQAKDDDIRWLIALLSDTGMRFAEGAGLKRSDIDLGAAVPSVTIQTNEARRLKTVSSCRTVPLVGASLWAARRLISNGSQKYLFPRYSNDGACKADHASNTFNEWIKSLGFSQTVHCLRHTMRDRLRNVGATEEVADRIGGWATKGIGQSYGMGRSAEVLHGHMLKIVEVEFWPE